MQHSDFHVQGPQIHQFNNIAPRAIPRSTFKRDFTRRQTMDTDYLYPIFLDEILPGDDVHLKMTALTRLATPIKPVMDNLYQETFWFFVPNRLVWNNWQAFQGEKFVAADGTSTAYTIPVLDSTKAPITTGFVNGSIYDYMGLPTQVTNLTGISALFNRAMELIWTEWFRDENLQTPITIQKGDGPDDPAIYGLRYRNKRKDYFTSMLPWPQKGTPVTVALGTTAPLINKGIFGTNNTGGPTPVIRNFATGALNAGQGLFSKTTTAEFAGGSVSGTTSYYDPNGSLVLDTNIAADLSNASAVTINALRQAALYQQILELDARGGTRYVESIYNRFGVISPDFRLQRPELIGQGSNRINIYAVPQTAPTAAGATPQGNLAAYGVQATQGQHGCRYAATEHGMIIGLMNVRADLTYQQGLPKMFTRSTRLDFYEPLLNGLGEQAVLNQELYAQGLAADKTAAGYQERFAEYRFKNSEICGKFRSNDAQSLDVWHLSQYFTSLPTLNATFIRETVPMNRVVAVTTEPKLLMDAWFDYTHVRPMPIRSNPGINVL